VTALVRGTGRPVTVFAHGYGATAADSRPFGSGVAGTKVFYTALAHDGVAAPDFGYPALAAQLRGIADEHDADQAFGASMGAGALCRLMADTPDRFTRAVFFLPALLDRPRAVTAAARLDRLGTLADAGDTPGVVELLLTELPAEVRDSTTARAYATRHAETICQPSMRLVPRRLTTAPVVESVTDLSEVSASCLIIGCRGDAAHPAEVAEQLADTLPNARLQVFDHPGIVWTERRELRRLIGDFLS